MNYGRKGLPIQAISAVDLALWDLLGKLRNEPVYALLGGKTKDRLPVYATSSRADLAQKMGFVGAKIPCPYGPSAGDEGFRKNVAFFKEAREKVGPDFPLMLDCYMALTVPYAIKVIIHSFVECRLCALLAFIVNQICTLMLEISLLVLWSLTTSSGWRSSCHPYAYVVITLALPYRLLTHSCHCFL